MQHNHLWLPISRTRPQHGCHGPPAPVAPHSLATRAYPRSRLLDARCNLLPKSDAALETRDASIASFSDLDRFQSVTEKSIGVGSPSPFLCGPAPGQCFASTPDPITPSAHHIQQTCDGCRRPAAPIAITLHDANLGPARQLTCSGAPSACLRFKDEICRPRKNKVPAAEIKTLMHLRNITTSWGSRALAGGLLVASIQNSARS